MKISYKYRLFGCFLLLFLLFTVSVIVLERSEEKKYRIESLLSQLDAYANTVNNYMEIKHIALDSIQQVKPISSALPPNIRLTIINSEGVVIYDKDVKNLGRLENHLHRPEVSAALYKQSGWNIRKSVSVNRPFLYFARYYNGYFIRVAIEYTPSTKVLLKANNYFLFFVFFLFVVILVFLFWVATRFAKSIAKLKKIVIDVRHDKPVPDNINFPHDELGDIVKELVKLFNKQREDKNALEAEKEKLIQHFKYSEEGLAIFDANMKNIYANTHFYQLVNLLTDHVTFHVEKLMNLEEIQDIKNFLKSPGTERYKSIQIKKNGKYFFVSVCIFEDKSCELRIRDITKTEKTRLLKQEMTANIAHELRTPVACLRGYLETLSEGGKGLPQEKLDLFIQKAYSQSVRLSELIEDISLLTKIEEAEKNYQFEKVDLSHLFSVLNEDIEVKLNNQGMRFFYIKEPIFVNANYGLLYSVFYNLADNAIKYAGKGAEIHAECTRQDDENVYLSFYDTGCGVEEVHLNRLFERFYRVSEGRTRNTGGSGLGLSIVYNAVMLHKGNIQVKKRKGGGLEFQIRLNK